MNEELEKIGLLRNVAVKVEDSSWNRGASRFPSTSKQLSYKADKWFFDIKYEVKISDYTKPNAFSNISDIHNVEISMKSYHFDFPKFEIIYRNKLNRFFFKRKSKFNVFCKKRKIKEVFYNDKVLDDFYKKVDLTTSGFEPYIQGLNYKEYFECKLSFFSSIDPKIEFTESLKLLEYLTTIFEKQSYQ